MTSHAVGARTLLLAAMEISLCVALPLLALSWVFGNAVGGGVVTDFEHAFYPAAEALLRGENPYPGVDDAVLRTGEAYVYPPLTAIATIPFTILTPEAAGILVMALLAGAVVATLVVLDVRDWRCYGLVFAWPAVYSAISTGNVSLFLALGAALVWRFRDDIGRAAASLGLGLALKLILLPLAVWLAATRRVKAAAIALLAAVAVACLSWAAIGFAGIRDYPDLLRRLQELEDDDGYTVYALGLDLGFSSGAARAVALAVALALVAAVVYFGRRGDDRRAFVLALAAALAWTPIVWLHYFSLLVVAAAVSERRLGLAWFVPLGMYVSAATSNGTTFQTGATLGIAALTIAAAIRPVRASPSVSFAAPAYPRLGE